MATNDDPFLAAIRAAPDDRSTRLAYADWLEERNDQRHELVRVCEAMRAVSVWSDRYWQLKARRNEQWTQCPIEWLEATGYDGSDYDPVLRDGVPDGWRERWRLVREFTERWHGVDVPDVGGQQEKVRQEEARLGLQLPPSVREFVAYAHDLGESALPYGSGPGLWLFDCAYYQLRQLSFHPGISLMTLESGVMGIALDDLDSVDPRTHFYSEVYEANRAYDSSGVPSPSPRTSEHLEPSLSLSIVNWLFTNLPVAGEVDAPVAPPDNLLAQLVVDFPIHARFDDTDVYECPEGLVCVEGPRSYQVRLSDYNLRLIVRRPISIESLPPSLFVHPDLTRWREWYRQQLDEERRQLSADPSARRMSVLRRAR